MGVGRPAGARILSLVAGALLAACIREAPSGPTAPPAAPSPPPSGPLSWRLDLLDVGTGLAILLHGADFALLYDGGSNDDRVLGPNNRLLAYLERRLGRSGGGRCRPDAAEPAELPERRLDHVVLSHPHRDHVALLPDVIGCFSVANVWDSGQRSNGVAYRAFLNAVSREPGVVYHTARPPSRSGRVRTRDDEFEMRDWRGFEDLTSIPLGRGASATVLHARFDAEDPNDASIVLRVDLGRASVLLTGDATAGPRGDAADEPAPGSTEHRLLRRHAKRLDVDVLQVAHHGSRTSSRRRFLSSVSPKWALISSGPTRYGDVTLPDPEAVAELERIGARVLRTDVDDAACATQPDKVGTVADGRPGGCSGATLAIRDDGTIAAEDAGARIASQ